MIRPILFALICCLTLFACTNDTAGESKTDATSNTTPPSKGTSKTITGKILAGELSPLENSVRNTICGIMIKTVDLKDGNLSIEYFKDATDYKSIINNPRMNDEFFKKYWSTSNRTNKIMSLVPAYLLSEHGNVKNVTITLYTGEQTLTTNIDRDKLAQFVGESWEKIQTDWKNRYRFVVVNSAEKRKAFFDQFVTVE